MKRSELTEFAVEEEGFKLKIRRDGEIHEVPAEEGGARRYRRLTFRTHVINIPGAGAILERTVRHTRSDREQSADTLAAQLKSLQSAGESARARALADATTQADALARAKAALTPLTQEKDALARALHANNASMRKAMGSN